MADIEQQPQAQRKRMLHPFVVSFPQAAAAADSADAWVQEFCHELDGTSILQAEPALINLQIRSPSACMPYRAPGSGS